MRITADETGGKSIAVCSQSISRVSAINPLVAFFDIHERKGGCYSFLCPEHHTTRDDTKENVFISSLVTSYYFCGYTLQYLLTFI
jgi:hypothetical protein